MLWSCAGSGKTFISKILEERYRGLRISNDDIRKIIDKVIRKSSLKEDKRAILEEYLFYMLERYNHSNGLIILDSSVDRLYKKISLAGFAAGFDLFIINIKVPRNFVEKRILSRNKMGAEDYFKEMDRWFREHEDFEKKAIIDITIRNKNGLNLNRLFLKLDKLLRV